VTSEDVQFVAQLVDRLCGVMLDESKAYLVESRLGQLAKDHGCQSYRELCQRARRAGGETRGNAQQASKDAATFPPGAAGDRALEQKIIDAITTQETLFFRDGSPFDALQNRILPVLIDGYMRSGGPKRLRFWSAGCSTGQEPYSLAIVLRETAPDFASWNASVLATDVSDAAIAQASRGWYAAHEIERGMRASLLAKYFEPHQGGWQVKDEIRAMVSFQRRNLLQPFSELGAFDVIFCRNVAIYFDAPRRRDLFLRLAERLAPGGAIVVGSSESLLDLGPQFSPRNHCRATYYQPNLKAVSPLPAALPAVDVSHCRY
jgi:chemotaxis protein methyltransferase CheR